MELVGGADESADLEFAGGALGSASNPDTSSVGVVLAVINTNFIKPIPVGSL